MYEPSSIAGSLITFCRCENTPKYLGAPCCRFCKLVTDELSFGSSCPLAVQSNGRPFLRYRVVLVALLDTIMFFYNVQYYR